MLTSVATVLHRTHRKRGVNKEMEGWMMEGSIFHIPSAGDDQKSEDAASFNSETMHRVSLSSSSSSHQRKRLSRVYKTTAVLKRAMTEKRERWQSKDWYGNTNS